MAAPQPTLGYYRGDNPHQPDFDPKFTGGLVTRLTCFKVPGVLHVKILENAVITIRSVRLFLWKYPKVGRGQPNNSLKKPSWVPSGVWTKNLPILIVIFQPARPLPQLLKLMRYLIRNIFMEKVYQKPAVKTSSMHLFNLVNSPKQPTHVWDF